MIFPQRADRIAAIVAGAVALAFLVLVVVLPSDMLLSARDTDMVSEFVAWRSYLADSLWHGHLPLWNPYTYGGQPFLGGFESAVFYPPNLLFLCLPLAPAINFSMLLHLVILGWGMQRWASRRGLGAGAAGVAGFVVPLSGAVFPHLYAGHLSNLCTMAWAPWIFWAFERWVSARDFRGLLLASAGVCLQILAGHVQYVFYTGIAAGLQALVLSVANPAARWRALPAVAGCYLAGSILGAAQLLPGLAASAEGIRHEKLDYAFAAMFSFPPENFLTLLAPGFFGSLGQPAYWGRCYLWEMSLFIGTASLPLIALACCDDQRRRQACLDLAVAGLLLVLASGVHTPLFGPLYDFAPGFGHFRSWSKFIFPATLFLVIPAAGGVDLLLRGKRSMPRVGWGSVMAGVMAGGVGLGLICAPDSIAGMLGLVASSRESYLPAGVFVDPGFIHQAGTDAGLSLGLAGLVLVAAGLALVFARHWGGLRWVVPGLLLAEMLGFAGGQVAVAKLSDAMPDNLRQFVSAHPGDYRVLDFAHPNNGFLLGAGDLSGNNPSLLRRYAEFMTFSQGGDPDHAEQYLPFHKIDPLYAMLRFRYAFVPTTQGYRILQSSVAPLPRVLLVSDWKTLPGRDALFSRMRDGSFDPAQTVLLESDPQPAPQPNAVGSATLLADSPDELDIQADTDRPALLLVTDLYARDWRAEPLAGSVQPVYHVMPADYVLRAVPLMAGHHHLRIVYAPTGLSTGIALSIVAWMVWLAMLIWIPGIPAERAPLGHPSS